MASHEQVALEMGAADMAEKVKDALGFDGEFDAVDNLEGALVDLRRTGANRVCIDTIERVQKQLIAVRAITN